MVKSKRRLHNKSTIIFNIIALIIDALLISAFLVLFVITLLLLLAIILRSGDICQDYVNFITAKFVPLDIPDNVKDIDNLIVAFGVFASITLIPVFTFIGSLFLSNKDRLEKVDEQFSKFKNLSLYIISLPYGTWNNQVLNYGNKYNKKNLKPLLDYDYCICLMFNNDCFRSFKVEVVRVEYEKSGKLVSIFDDLVPFFISDTSGMSKGQQKESTTLLSLLLELEENGIKKEIESEFVNHLLNGKKSKKINFIVNLQPREYTAKEALFNFFRFKYKYAFPLIRSFFRMVVSKIQAGKDHRIELSLGPLLKNINEEDIKFYFEIIDINIETIRKYNNIGRK